MSVFTRWILKKHKQPAICREFWEKDGISHTIIGKISHDELLRIAESIS
ncbi:DUF4367 domain-containing protein [Faecalibacterium prausnitzii]|nr:DUF4367 domain-containing protein [Faecalibacterium prausnitzii]